MPLNTVDCRPLPATIHPAVADPDRLDSWKEIAAYLRRDVTTVQRWERREHMPVHRHLHDKLGSVYAFRVELDEWMRRREPERDDIDRQDVSAAAPAMSERERSGGRRRASLWLLVAVTLIAAIGVSVRRFALRDSASGNLLSGARFLPLTDFPGNEHAAALSRDGKFAAFLSDRDGAMDVWVTQIGTGRFYNLTQDDDKELTNASLRMLGF